MRISSFYLALVLGVQSILLLQARERPLSFVSDPSSSLPRETRNSLESFLTTRSNRLQTEVFVLLEPLPAPSLEEAKPIFEEFGNSWSEDNWAIISFRPGQIGAPLIITGGPFLREIVLETWQNELTTLQELSLQSWQTSPDIDFLARQVADSLAFVSRFKSATVQSLVQDRNEEILKKHHSDKTQKAYLIAISTALLLALAALAFLLRKAYLARKKLHFPETKWNSRLGAPHSGGSALIHRFPPPQA